MARYLLPGPTAKAICINPGGFPRANLCRRTSERSSRLRDSWLRCRHPWPTSDSSRGLWTEQQFQTLGPTEEPQHRLPGNGPRKTGRTDRKKKSKIKAAETPRKRKEIRRNAPAAFVRPILPCSDTERTKPQIYMESEMVSLSDHSQVAANPEIVHQFEVKESWTILTMFWLIWTFLVEFKKLHRKSDSCPRQRLVEPPVNLFTTTLLIQNETNLKFGITEFGVTPADAPFSSVTFGRKLNQSGISQVIFANWLKG